MVKLVYKDAEGKEVEQEFDLKHAQRILDVRHPQNPWKLKDEEYAMSQGKIQKV